MIAIDCVLSSINKPPFHVVALLVKKLIYQCDHFIDILYSHVHRSERVSKRVNERSRTPKWSRKTRKSKCEAVKNKLDS